MGTGIGNTVGLGLRHLAHASPGQETQKNGPDLHQALTNNPSSGPLDKDFNAPSLAQSVLGRAGDFSLLPSGWQAELKVPALVNSTSAKAGKPTHWDMHYDKATQSLSITIPKALRQRAGTEGLVTVQGAPDFVIDFLERTVLAQLGQHEKLAPKLLQAMQRSLVSELSIVFAQNPTMQPPRLLQHQLYTVQGVPFSLARLLGGGEQSLDFLRLDYSAKAMKYLHTEAKAPHADYYIQGMGRAVQPSVLYNEASNAQRFLKLTFNGASAASAQTEVQVSIKENGGGAVTYSAAEHGISVDAWNRFQPKAKYMVVGGAILETLDCWWNSKLISELWLGYFGSPKAGLADTGLLAIERIRGFLKLDAPPFWTDMYTSAGAWLTAPNGSNVQYDDDKGVAESRLIRCFSGIDPKELNSLQQHGVNLAGDVAIPKSTQAQNQVLKDALAALPEGVVYLMARDKQGHIPKNNGAFGYGGHMAYVIKFDGIWYELQGFKQKGKDQIQYKLIESATMQDPGCTYINHNNDGLAMTTAYNIMLMRVDDLGENTFHVEDPIANQFVDGALVNRLPLDNGEVEIYLSPEAQTMLRQAVGDVRIPRKIRGPEILIARYLADRGLCDAFGLQTPTQGVDALDGALEFVYEDGYSYRASIEDLQRTNTRPMRTSLVTDPNSDRGTLTVGSGLADALVKRAYSAFEAKRCSEEEGEVWRTNDWLLQKVISLEAGGIQNAFMAEAPFEIEGPLWMIREYLNANSLDSYLGVSELKAASIPTGPRDVKLYFKYLLPDRSGETHVYELSVLESDAMLVGPALPQD